MCVIECALSFRFDYEKLVFLDPFHVDLGHYMSPRKFGTSIVDFREPWMLMVEPRELDSVIWASYIEDCKSPWKLRAKCNHRAEV